MESDGDSLLENDFDDEFDDVFPVGLQAGNSAYFGRDVLRGLVEGIDEFIKGRMTRERLRYRSLGPALLGSAMWIDDPELIEKIGELAAACIIVTKQKGHSHKKLEPLSALNTRTPGMPVQAFWALTGVAPKVDGKPLLVGPSSPTYDGTVPTIRAFGVRRVGNDLVPILHAKLALVGNLWWSDEDGSGHVADVVGFNACRLWVSSANFTGRSRRSLEFGYWTEEPALVQGAERFLTKLMGSSEGLDAVSDSFDPDLAPVEFDDVAMPEAGAGMWSAEDDDTGADT